jgi:hypothetical protein
MALLALAVTGCGVGFGPGESSGLASLLVTRDFGRSEVGRFEVDEVGPATTALRALEAELPVRTAYGGGFVDGIDGIDSRTGGDPADWFYFVNGIEAEVGAADLRVLPGDRIWWDYREWGEVMYVGSVVGSYPAPLAGGYRDEDWPVEVVCRADQETCDLVRGELEDDGIELDGKPGSGAIDVVVGTWQSIRDEYEQLGGPPSRSGVFATFAGGGLRLLDPDGREVVEESDRAGLIASVGGTGKPPTWMVTGTDRRGVREAAALLEPERLARSYAVAAVDGESVRLPVERPGGRE